MMALVLAGGAPLRSHADPDPSATSLPGDSLAAKPAADASSAKADTTSAAVPSSLAPPSSAAGAPSSSAPSPAAASAPASSPAAASSPSAAPAAAPAKPEPASASAPGAQGPDDGAASAPAASHASAAQGSTALAHAPTLVLHSSAAPGPPAHGPVLATPEAAANATAAPAGPAFPPPARFDDVTAWLDYRSHNHIGALPQESRIFYRRGLQLYSTGSFDEAVRFLRGACDLDADYVAPHLTLASWFVLREPSQALLQFAASLELARENFVLQLSLLANVLVVAIQSLFLGLLAAAVLLVFLRNAQLRHIVQERLGLIVELRGARIWAWGFVVLPFLAGVGLALPALAMLGLLWSTLRVRERIVFIGLTLMIGAAPWFAGSIDRLTVPLRPEAGPFFGIPELAAEPYSPDRQQQITDLADHHPDDAFAHFALGWLARRGGDLQLAERAYRRALQIWPTDDRVLNNLGNTLAMQGRPDEALDMYQKAYAADPHNAAAYFNASQIFTQRYEYKSANDALQRASSLNFDLVKAYQAQATEDGLLPLVDQWLAPRTFWRAMPAVHASGSGGAMLPPSWRSQWECSGWFFSVFTVLLAIGAAFLGRRLHTDMPLRSCSNCGCVVCRRCAERRRETALCATCAAVENQAESAEFARVLLMQRRRGVKRRWEMLRTALATLIPGFGMLSLDRLFLPLLLLSATAGLCGPWIGLKAPFSFEPRLLEGAHDTAMWIGVTTWLLVYACSLLGYFIAQTRHHERAETPEISSRPRGGDPPRRITAAAA